MNVRLTLLEIISGQRKGVMAGMTRFGLSVLSPIYRVVVNVRNWRFDRFAKSNRNSRDPKNGLIKYAPIPVISIGNLTVGGTGKTPLVIWLAERLLASQHQPMIISRGYKACPESGRYRSSSVDPQSINRQNDEALEIKQRLPDVPHLQSTNRFQAALSGTQQFSPEVAILDDGFQHRQLHRDLDWVLIDTTNPFGYDHLLPRGLLREPIEGLRRADAIILTRCELVSDQQQFGLLQKIRQSAPDIPVAKVAVQPSHWIGDAGRRLSLAELSSQKLMAVCAIGNPANFFATLERSSFKICHTKIFPDHHQFSQTDLISIRQIARENQAEAIVCTHKDWVKIYPLLQSADAPFPMMDSESTSSKATTVARTKSCERNGANSTWGDRHNSDQELPVYALVTCLTWIENEQVLIKQVADLMKRFGEPQV